MLDRFARWMDSLPEKTANRVAHALGFAGLLLLLFVVWVEAHVHV